VQTGAESARDESAGGIESGVTPESNRPESLSLLLSMLTLPSPLKPVSPFASSEPASSPLASIALSNAVNSAPPQLTSITSHNLFI
jgi:hypothetical protein